MYPKATRSADLPANAQVRSEFGEYKATYGLADGVLTTERRLSLSKRKLPTNQWQDFLKFEKAVYKDESQVISMVKGGVEVTQGNAEATALIQQAMQAIQNGGMNAAHDALARAERLNPKQRGLWTGYGYLYFVEKRFDKSIVAYEREIKNHPDDASVYKYVAQTETNLGLQDKAIEAWRGYLKLVPNEVDALVQLSRLLNESNRSNEALDPAEEAVKLLPDDFQLQALLADVYLRIGRKQDGLATIKRIIERSPDSSTLNTSAYILAETNTELPMAKEYAEKAVSAEEENATKITLSSLTDADMRRMMSLAASWDTLGWTYFRLGDLNNAEKYINASWTLSQFPVVGDHLGQVYERQGKKEAAIETYELALAAAGSGMNDTRDRLERLGGAPDQPVIAPKGSGALNPKSAVVFKVSPAEKLAWLRAADIPFNSKHQESAEFFLLFSGGKVSDVQFITGVESLKKLAPELYKAHYILPVPDTVPVKLVRRGVLACPALGPYCRFVLIPPSVAKK